MMGGRDQTADRRAEQAAEVMKIVTARFGEELDGDFIVLGDLNDYLDPYPDGRVHPLAPIDNVLHNVVAELTAPLDAWTHYYDDDDAYRQLDYLYVSPRLWAAAQADGGLDVHIERQGLPWRAERFDGDRIDGVGEDSPKASDHCPVVLQIPESAIQQVGAP